MRIIKAILISSLILIICMPVNVFALTDATGDGQNVDDEIVVVDGNDTTVKTVVQSDVVCTTTPKNYFVKCLTEKKAIKRADETVTISQEECVKMINDAAKESCMIEYGILPDFKTSDELYEYLSDRKNKIAKVADNYIKLSVGDIVFYEDCPGVVVTGRTLLLCDDEGKPVSLELKRLNNIKGFKMKYPYFEKLASDYMRKTLRYNNMKICGILANVIAESNINPTAEENTSYRGFGICQWTDERNDKLLSYCEKNKKNPISLYSQLDFMDEELKTDFAGLNNTLDNYLTRDEDGAYSAAFDFCIRFENPLSSDNAVDRGVMSEDQLWPLYKNQ